MRFAIKEACGKRSKNDFSNGKRSQTTSMFHLHFAISSPMCMYACAHVQARLWQISKRFFEVLWGTNNMCDGVPRTCDDVTSHLILHVCDTRCGSILSYETGNTTHSSHLFPAVSVL